MWSRRRSTAASASTTIRFSFRRRLCLVRRARVTPSRERNLDEVRAQVEAKWRDDQISTKLRAKATDMVGKLEQAAPLAAEARPIGSKVETATVSGAMPRAGRALRCDHRGVPPMSAVWTDPRRRWQEWHRVEASPISACRSRRRFPTTSKKLKETLLRGPPTTGRAIRHKIGVRRFGTTINQAAFAQ